MKSFKDFTGRPVVIMKDNIDTDILIPKEFLKTTKRTGFEDHVFAPWRYTEDGTPAVDFPLNQAAFQGASVLITGENFGCGSSREHAVWALQDWGIRVIVAGGFSGIFFNNFLNNGNLPVILNKTDRDWLAALDPQTEISIDIAADSMYAAGRTFPLGLSQVWIERLTEGKDAIDVTLDHLAAIEQYEAKSADKS